MNINIDLAVRSILGIFSAVTGKWPQFGVNGGSRRENVALQNVQVSVHALLPWLCLFFLLKPRCLRLRPCPSVSPGQGQDGAGIPVCPAEPLVPGEARWTAGAGLR